MTTFAATAQTVNPAAAEIEAGILAAEGPYHVSGRYIADPSLAARARRAEAERRVRDAERRAAWLADPAHACRWCGQLVGLTESFELIAGAPVHTDGCMSALDEMLYPSEVAA